MNDDLLAPPVAGLTNRYVDPRHPLTQELAGVLRALKGPGDALRGAYQTEPEVAGQWSDRDDAREAANADQMARDANSATLMALTGGMPGAQAGALGALGGKLNRRTGHVDHEPPRRVNDPGAPENVRTTSVPMSPATYEDVGRVRYEDWWNESAKEIDVPTSKLRATQDWVTQRGPSTSSGVPEGVMTSDGLVHIFDGHHRADVAVKNGEPTLRVQVNEIAAPMSDVLPRYSKN